MKEEEENSSEWEGDCDMQGQAKHIRAALRLIADCTTILLLCEMEADAKELVRIIQETVAEYL